MNTINHLGQVIQLELPRLSRAVFLERPNRFLGKVELSTGQVVQAFIADPGRLRELLYPGAVVYLAAAPKEGRKTFYDLRLVEYGQTLVSVDSRVPNKLLGKAFREGVLQPFLEYSNVNAEPQVKNGRLDFFLTGGAVPCYVEVKSCTLVKGKTALFPDAPTVRGAKHARELIRLKEQGYRTAMVFLVQHPNAMNFSPNKLMDPDFTEALGDAVNSGVEIFAYACSVSLEKIALKQAIPVLL